MGHKKYFYIMKKFRDYAIITLDDDIYYTKSAFESLYNSYLKYPNLISGRRSHYMTYKEDGELKEYKKWKFEQNYTLEPDFNLFLTGSGGIIYPPDILNINENHKFFIKQSLTTDDFTLKYLENLKGIPIKWVFNRNNLGIKLTNLLIGKTLYKINLKNDYNNKFIICLI